MTKVNIYYGNTHENSNFIRGTCRQQKPRRGICLEYSSLGIQFDQTGLMLRKNRASKGGRNAVLLLFLG